MNLISVSDSKETSATHGAYTRLRQMILTGELQPGEKLKIEQLRGMLKTGASPVREALSLLVSDMLVDRIDQRGFRTASVGKANFEEILLLRSALEEKALRASIANADARWEEQLVLSHHRMKMAGKAKDGDFEAAHKDFHMALIAQANMPMLERYCSQLYDLNIRYRYLAAGGPRYQERSIETEHQEILDAAIERDADTTARLLLDHYSRTGEYLSRQLESAL